MTEHKTGTREECLRGEPAIAVSGAPATTKSTRSRVRSPMSPLTGRNDTLVKS